MSKPRIAELKKSSQREKEKLLRSLDATEASTLLWQGLREGTWGEFRKHSGKMREEHTFLLKHPEAAATGDWIRLANLLGQDPLGHAVPDWGRKAEEALRLALAHDREGLLSRAEELDAPLRQQLEAVRMLEGEPDAASDETLEVLARAWAEERRLYPDNWFVKHRDALPMDRLARALVRACPTLRRVRNAELVDAVLGHLSPPEKVAVLVRYDGNDRRGRALAIVEGLEDGAALVDAELAELRADDGLREARANAAYLRAQLHLATGEDVPEALDEGLRTFSVQDADVELDRRLFRALPKDRALKLAGWTVWGNRKLLGIVDDQTWYDRAVGELGGTGTSDIAQALGEVGEPALPALTRALEGKPPAKQATGIAQALRFIRTEESAGLLLKLLGSSSKVVREAAQKSLGELGAVARPAIAEGAKARKKAVREASEELLSILEARAEVADSPLGRLEEEAAELDEEARAAILALPDGEHGYEKHAREMVDAHGPVVLVVLRDWFLETFPEADYRAIPPYLGCVDHLRGRDRSGRKTDDEARPMDAEAAAYVVLDAIARLPKMRKFRERQLRKRAPRTFGEWAAEAAASALRSRKTPLAEILYEIAAKDPAKTRDVLLDGLDESGKGLRATCVEALATLGEDVVDDVVPLLSAKKKNARDAAARVLAAVGSAKAAPALGEALEKESSDDVRLAMEDALRASGGDPTPATPDAAASDGQGEGAGAGAWEETLTAGKKPRLPKWVDLAALPPLTLASGEALSDDARAGLIGRLKKEHERPDAEAAALASVLAPASAAAFGEALCEQWQRAGKGKAAHKWALYQLGHFASDAWIHRTAPQLDAKSSGGRHALAGWHLEVYARRDTKAGRDWIGYWADHATTDGLQKKALAQLRALAEARGVTEAALRRELDPFVADDRAEREVSDLGFDPHGEQKLSYGPREMTIRLGADGGLSVVDDAGKALKGLPKPKKSDDAAKAKEAREAFERLKGTVGRVLKGVVRRFERGMVSGRTWGRARFEEVFLKHPIFSTVGTGLVFATEDGATFRVSEERTLLDAAGDDVALGEDATVHIVHPLELDEETRAAWRDHLEDADVVQPFAQVHRPTFTKGDAPELSKERIPSRAFVARVREAGWNRGRPEDAGLVYYDWIRMPARGVTVRLDHSGYAAGGGWDEPVTLEGLHFATPTGKPIGAEKVDPIAFSEAWYAAQRLFGGAKEQKEPGAGAEARPAAAAPKSDASGTTQKALLTMSAGFPSADHAPSSRAKCMHCDEKIEKGSVRIVIEREISTPRFTGKGPGYMHGPCAVAWAEANGLDQDDFVSQVRANTKLDHGELPEPFGA